MQPTTTSSDIVDVKLRCIVHSLTVAPMIQNKMAICVTSHRERLGPQSLTASDSLQSEAVFTTLVLPTTGTECTGLTALVIDTVAQTTAHMVNTKHKYKYN